MDRDYFIYVLYALLLVSWISFMVEILYIVGEVDERAEEHGYLMWRDVKYYPIEEVISGDK